MRQSIAATYAALRRVFLQRCFYLFVTLLALIAAAPFNDATPSGVLITNLIDTSIVLCGVAAVGRSMLPLVITLCLAVPSVVLRWLSTESQASGYYDWSLKLHAAVYAITIALLLRYAFDREVITADRLWGAAAAYLMIGALWSFLYAIIDRANLESFSVRGLVAPLQLTDLIYFSFSTLTTTGFGDIVPVARLARSASVIESIVGQLFSAILISKLLGVYPPLRRKRRRGKNPQLIHKS